MYFNSKELHNIQGAELNTYFLIAQPQTLVVSHFIPFSAFFFCSGNVSSTDSQEDEKGSDLSEKVTNS